MKNKIILLSFILILGFIPGIAQNSNSEKKIKSITSYNVDRKIKELDHLTNYNREGLKTEEYEYFADGKIKTKTVFEYNKSNNCIKVTKYDPKGKIEKVIIHEYDAAGNKIKESTLNAAKHTRTEKIFEYSYF